jgi:hypothetical protein
MDGARWHAAAVAAITVVLSVLFVGMASAEDYGCGGCVRMTPSQFDRTLNILRKTRPLRVDIFAQEFMNKPFAAPLRAVERGARCTIVDREQIDKLVAMVSELKLSLTERGNVDSAVELRFYQTDRASQRPLLEAFFSMGVLGGDKMGGAATPAAMNGRLVMVHSRQVEKILDFAGNVTMSPGNKVCQLYKRYNN